MPKKDWKKVFNLNTYEWWRNHRRVVTFALLLFAFGSYLKYPYVKYLKIKDICARFTGNEINLLEVRKKLNVDIKNGGDIWGYCRFYE